MSTSEAYTEHKPQETNGKISPHPYVPSVFLEYRFILLFLTMLVSSFSVSFFLMATNWYIVDYLGLEAMLGLVFFASSVPRLLFMLIGGVIADRVDKAWIMFFSDFTKGLLLIGVIVFLIFDVLTIWPLIILAFLFGILDAFFWPASTAILPETVKMEQLTRANTVINMTRQSSMIIGPLLAGIMLATGGCVLIFFITSVTLIIAGVIDILLKQKTAMVKSTENNHAKESPKEDSMLNALKEGFLYMKKSPFLITLMCTTLFLNLFFSGPLQLGMPLYASQVLDGNEVSYSFLLGGMSGGMVVGSIVIGFLNIQRKRGLISVIAIICLGLIFLGLSISTHFIVSMACTVLLGITISIIDIPLLSVIQSHTEKQYLGRVMSCVSFASMGLLPISYLLTSLLLSMQIPIQTIMLWNSLGLIVLCVIILIKAKALRTAD